MRSWLFALTGVFFVAGTTCFQALSVEVDHVLIEVNGNPRRIQSDNQIQVVRGDTLKIVSAQLNGMSQADVVNLVGYRNKSFDPNNPEDDRGYLVDTAKELKRGYSIQKKGKQYQVIIKSSENLQARMILKIVDPELMYAVVKINGKHTVLRTGELIKARSTDKVKVEQVVTNLDSLDNDVTFQIVPKAANVVPGLKSYEIRFLRRNVVFARIPLHLEDS